MSAFVVLAIALAAVIAGVTAVAASQLLKGVKELSGVVRQARATLQPLVDELQAETAVTALEGERLQGRLEGLQEQRSGQAEGKARRRRQRAALRRRSEP